MPPINRLPLYIHQWIFKKILKHIFQLRAIRQIVLYTLIDYTYMCNAAYRRLNRPCSENHVIFLMRLYLLGSLIKIDVVIVEYKEVIVIPLNV